jgi:hypothetical protein
MHEVSTGLCEDQHRHPLITRTILFLLQWLTLQRYGDLEVFATTLTNSVMDLRTTPMCTWKSRFDKKDSSQG